MVTCLAPPRQPSGSLHGSVDGVGARQPVTVAAAIAVPKVIKSMVDRQQPDRCGVGRDRRGVGISGKPHNSFLSGHSVHLGAVVGALAWAKPRRRTYIYAVGGVLAATRIAVLAHWPTDVLPDGH
ncbi:phosphatase PAP2 family protein [Bradyrhizobium shewense]|uniref:phosphatase PAP2 family protein n=1 Tax=Bradyrhizobium shewense TaxID=1761772 RepID=UPI000B87828D